MRTVTYLAQIKAQNVRILRSVSLVPSRSINVIVGGNGSGKTSLLEIVYLLGSGRSFRTRRAHDVITHGESELLAFGEIVDAEGHRDTIGVQKARGTSRVRVSGEDVRNASTLAGLMPVLLITPQSQQLLNQGARYRRRLIDWALFHVEPEYFGLLNRYRQALRQRNVLLKDGKQGRILESWSEKVGQLGDMVHAHRDGYVEAVRPNIKRIAEDLLGCVIGFKYQPGWNVTEPLGEALAKESERDVVRGFTGLGPHRADLEFKINELPVQDFLSRGEEKLLAIGILISHVTYLVQCANRVPVVLVDDLASELDTPNRARLVQALQSVNCQVFITTLEGSLVEPLVWDNTKVFHVEQGEVREVL